MGAAEETVSLRTARRCGKNAPKSMLKLLKNHNKTIGQQSGALTESQLDLGYTSWLLVTFRSEAASNVTSSS